MRAEEFETITTGGHSPPVLATVPDHGNPEPLRYFANSEAEAAWARDMWPGMPVVINLVIPTT